MRKSFTRFLSVFMLFCAFGLQAALAVGPTWDGTKSIPKDGSDNVKPADIATQFVLAFSDTPAITATGGTMAVYKGGVLVKVVPINQTSSNVSVVGKTLVVNHGIASFSEETAYTIVLTSGAVTVGGTGVSIPSGDYDFITGDYTAPKLITTAPLAPVGSGVKANLTYPGGPALPFQLTMKFNENVVKGTGDIAVYNVNGTVIDLIKVTPTSPLVSIVGSIATITVDNSSYFGPQTDYFVKVDAGTFVDDSENENEYLGITNNTAWTFSTRDNSAPSITASVTGITATSAQLNISISEAGKYSYKIQTEATADPAAADYTGFTAATALAANTNKVVTLPGLAGGVKYEVFVVAENNESPANKSAANGKKLTFTTTDNTGPVTYGPAGVPANGRGLITTNKQTTGVYIYFNEQVKGGTGTLSVRRVSDNELMFSVPASAVTSTKVTSGTWNNKYKATINFGGALASGVDYYIVFPAGYIEDMIGNDYVSTNNTGAAFYPVPVNYTDWVITSDDFEAPKVTFTTTTKTTETTSNITGAGLADDIFIHFDEEAYLVDGEAWNPWNDFEVWSKYLAFQKDGITVPAAFSYSGGVITINPDANLTSNTTYTVILRPGVVQDDNENVLAAAKSITVTTGDNDVLHATFGPVADLTGYTPLTITFNKAVRAIKTGSPAYEALTTSNVESKIKVEKYVDGVLAGTVDAADYLGAYDAATRKITVTPVTGKAWATSNQADIIGYRLSILADKIEDNGGTDVEDAAGAVTLWDYVVEDYKKPIATLVDNEIDVADPLTVTFDEPVSEIYAVTPEAYITLKMVDAQGNNIEFATAWDVDMKVLTITPTPALAIGKTYYYGVGANMADYAGNINDAVYKSFKVVGAAPIPVVEALTYTVNGGTATPIDDTYEGVTVNTNGDIVVKVTFNVNVDDKDLTAINTVATTFDNTVPADIDVTIVNTDVSGKVLTITIPDPVIPASEPGTEYTITIPEGLLEANEAYTGTTFAQMDGDVVITVKTKDTELPTFAAYVDEDEAGVLPTVLVPTDVVMDATVTLEFSEAVTPVAGKTIKFQTGAGPTTEESITIGASSVVAVDEDGLVWEVKHVDFLKYGTTYTVVVAKDAFKDAANNTLGAADKSFQFTTIENPAPLVDSFSPEHLSDMAPTSLDMNIVFNEPIEQASVTGSRKLIYVIEQVGAADATINGDGDLVIGDDDIQKYFAYVDETAKVVVSGSTVTIKGVTLEAAKNYYVLITPGAFKDKSLGDSGIEYYAGITAAGTWNFTTSDVYAPEVEVSFNALGADGLVAPTSNIILTFNKKIVKNGGAAITRSDIPTLIKLEKWDGDGWVNLEFTANIVDENVITIENSSLVVLNEMKPDTKYKVSFGTPVLEGKVSHTDMGAFAEEFWTTDATKPAMPVITFANDDEINDIYFDDEDGHVIELNIAASDVNSELVDQTQLKVYYLKLADNQSLEPVAVKGLAEATKTLSNDGDFDVTYTGGMTSETSYFIFAVAEDVAGNLSDVAVKEVITDDVVKPALAGALPTAFDADGNIKLVFNEDVEPVEDAYARVIDNLTGITYLMPLANADEEDEDELNAITIVGGSFIQMAEDVANYTIEIDPGMIVDVPRVIEEEGDANDANEWDGIVGTSFVVSSSDQVNPSFVELVTPETPAASAVNQTFTLKFDEPVKLTEDFVQYLIEWDDDAEETWQPYDVITAENISGGSSNMITITPNRAFVSGESYRLTVVEETMEDLAGNLWNDGDVVVNFTIADVVPLQAAFRTPQEGDPFYLPVAEPLEEVPNNVCIAFGKWNGESGWDGDIDSENFYINPNDPNINTYELKGHLFLKANGVDIPFTIEWDSDRIRFYPVEGFEDYKGQTITYGFVNLSDAAGNVNTGASVEFTIAEDAVINKVVTFIPGDNDGDSDTEVNITVDQTFKVEFDGLIYSYNSTEALNNLILNAAWLNSHDVFELYDEDGEEYIDITVLSLTEVAGKHVVTLKADEALESLTVYTLRLNSGLIQIGQGYDPLGVYTETFVTGDVKAPKLISDGDGVALPASYKPVKVGIAGKDQTLALQFDEKVKGAGNVIIHRWDGVQVASVDISSVVSAETSTGSGIWQLNIGKLSDIMAANAAMVTNTDYYIVVPAGVVVDMATTPNAFAGITTVNEWKISLRDDTKPLVTFIDNMKNGVAVDTKIKLTFDRPVDFGAGWLALYYEDGKAVDLVRTTAGTTAMTSYDFTLNRELAANTKFLVELGVGTFELAADNAIKQDQVNIGGWYFSTEVNAAPVPVTFAPAKTTPMTMDVPLNSGLTITFDQDVLAGTGNIQLHRKQDVGGPIITNFNVADPTKVTFNGNTLTIAGDVLNLQNFSEYYVIIPGTAVKNTSSTPEYWAGITVPFEWQFKTFNDVTGPTAVYAPTTTGLLPADVKLTMTFNEAVMAGTGNVVIYNAADDAVVETIAFTPAMLVGKVATVVPTVALAQQTTYYVQVAAGLVKDVWGNEYLGVADKTTWKFTTGDFTGPTVVVTPPTAPVPTVFTVGLKFSEAVSGVLGGVTVTGGTLTSVDGLGDTYTLTVSAVEQKEVTIVLTDAIKDISPNTNKFAGDTLVYTTGDFTAPQVVAVSPEPESTLADNHPVFTATFNENVKIGTGNLTVYKVNTTVPVLTLPISGATVDGKTVTLSYTYNATTGGLDKDTRYYVLVDATAITDMAGNKFAGISNVSDWTFKTGPTWVTGVDPIVNGSLEFKVYPNPFVDYVNVANASELSKVVVTNIAGQTVKEVVNPTERIQLNELRSGIYFMSLYNADDVVVKTAKIVKR